MQNPCAPYTPRKPRLSDYYRCVEDYFEELERVHEERYQSPKKAKSYPCPAQVPVLAIEAWGYVPLVGKGHDLALNIAFWLEGSVDSLMRKPVYLTNVEEYPPEKLKQIRPYNFYSESTASVMDMSISPMPVPIARRLLTISFYFMSRMVCSQDAILLQTGQG